jgi:hypothetical protein
MLPASHATVHRGIFHHVVDEADGIFLGMPGINHVVDEADGIFLGMPGINLQGPDAGCIIDCSVLVTLQLMTSFIDKSQKLNINLNVMTRDLFLIAFVCGRSVQHSRIPVRTANNSVYAEYHFVLEGLRGEGSIAELCRREGINSNLDYRWSKDFLDAGKRRLAGDTVREANSGMIKR